MKKVKLLRQLGMTLEQIKNLERGEADFDEVLRIQLGVLSKDINQKQRAREVCGNIRSDKADYATLDAEVCLKELFRPAEHSPVIMSCSKD